MNRSSFAFFVALLIHLLFLLLFFIFEKMSQDSEQSKPKENKIKISLKEMPKKNKKSALIEKPVPPIEIAPPMPKGSQLKQIIKKPLVKYKPKQLVKKPKLKPKTKPKPQVKKTRPKIEPLPPKKPYIKLQDHNKTRLKVKPESIKKDTKPIDPLYAMLLQDRSSQEKKETKLKPQDSSSINQNIKELYGSEFGKLSVGQQKYILDNQEIMRRITQEILSRVARVNIQSNLNVNKSNVIEFYLHPNGDMSDFRFLKKSGYYILDDTTKETISYAYSRYPSPSEKTLIRYNVYYNLAY